MAGLIDVLKAGQNVLLGNISQHTIPVAERDGGFLPIQGRLKTIQGIACSWLPYAPGKISWEELTGRDVLSGSFSGCWMVVYNWFGMTRVGHIGTVAPADAATANVHREWDAFRHDHPAWVLRAFKPYSPNRDQNPAPAGKTDNALPTWLGLVTAQRECYSIFCYPQTKNPDLYRIVEVRRHQEALNPAGPHPMK